MHAAAPPGLKVAYEPAEDDPAVRQLKERGVDLVVACALDALEEGNLSVPILQAGFPSYRHHAFHERPTLGFEGFAGFVDRLAEALSRRTSR